MGNINYNILGQVVKTLFSQQVEPGNYSVTWDGTNNLGQRVASGIYLYRLQAGKYVETKKMVFLK